MHFPIIELTTKKKTPEQIKNSSIDYDDAFLQSECDYFGEEYTSLERVDLIQSDEIKKLLPELNGTEKEESVSKKIKEKTKAARSKKAKTSKKKEEVAI